MSTIPRSAAVDNAIKATVRAVENSLGALNVQAGKLMSLGQYDKAEVLAQRGRDIKAFVQDVESLRARWRSLRQGQRREQKPRNEKTPLWAYYQPILRALEALGGEAKRDLLMAKVEALMGPALKRNDRDPLSGGRLERWQVMVLRARKHMVEEGWLAQGTKLNWRITDAGRASANAKGPNAKKPEQGR